ncbi:hypothetical protein [Streptomyces sp. NPDC086023]|uniref:hypothetical protein n=1 Tax=Streptomyces sp. NPDC086023 TaxID=3365746 RepID=UPI0037D76467
MRGLRAVMVAVSVVAGMVSSSPVAAADALDSPAVSVVFSQGDGNVIGNGNNVAGRDLQVGSGHVAGTGHSVAALRAERTFTIRNNRNRDVRILQNVPPVEEILRINSGDAAQYTLRQQRVQLGVISPPGSADLILDLDRAPECRRADLLGCIIEGDLITLTEE